MFTADDLGFDIAIAIFTKKVGQREFLDADVIKSFIDIEFE